MTNYNLRSVELTSLILCVKISCAWPSLRVRKGKGDGRKRGEIEEKLAACIFVACYVAGA